MKASSKLIFSNYYGPNFACYSLLKKVTGPESLKKILTLKEPEYLGDLKAGGGRNHPAVVFRAPVWLISMQIIHKWSQMKADIFIYL